MEEFQLSKFTKEGVKLLRDVKGEFERLNIDASKLPKNFPDDSDKIKLVFVGQFSAGKSSIIKMLTGEDIAIGAKITTQIAEPYSWNGLEIIDTPGVCTELRPDHDELTYDQINHAALLIFVITNEGFSQRIGDHFRELAIDQKRANNMVLVVNKMDRTALGNVSEQQNVIYEDMKKVTAPYDPKNLYLSFLNTSAYFESLEEDDAELKSEYLIESGYEAFVENLNRFVADKGVLQKINLPLNTIAAEIRSALNITSDEDKKDIEAFIETFEKKKQIIEEGKKICFDEVQDIANQCKDEITRLGRNVADNIISQSSQEEAKSKYQESQKQIESIVKKYEEPIADCIKNFVSKVDKDIKEYDNSNFVRQVNMNVLNIIKKEQESNGSALLHDGGVLIGAGGAAAGMMIFTKGAEIASQYATPLTEVVTSALGNLVGNAVKGTATVALAEDAGIFSTFIANELGNLVKGLPFFQETIVAEATTANKIAQFFTGNGSKFLGVGLSVLSASIAIWIMIKDSKKQEEAERKRSQARESITEDFRNIASEVNNQIINGVTKWVSENIDPMMIKFDDDIKKLHEQIEQSGVKNENLTELLQRTENLIADVQEIDKCV